ncbi:PREDICTED: uncharacterized protein LOC100632130 isoform X2 [Amphimedon queenslandica]|uniref:BHLH domain-containing protein n=1 Tax=Amphimedon queenslandica TaxID=400682 RepID=A0A1X7U0U2_AMPQE|nr:PREDICTED: uncharacterized protein LOC100632130 isoform X2 [Amphimedon queenslandica]|eukprot:XP_011406317.1 PREDICTED: uncharacterized protein LOC100632130 isoform X2 [Amphimedon queenslandica]
MELSTRAGDDGVDQSVVETVEVVAGSSGTGGAGGGEQRVLSPGGTETTLRIISPQLSIPSSGIIEIDPQALSSLVTPNFDVSTVTSLSLATNPATTLSGSGLQESLDSRVKRTHDEMIRDTPTAGTTPDVPRKKSRYYLDSHKSIEKKRRDRINNGLQTLKDIVPNCRQYSSQGSKKLDKAEVLEMTIDYIQRLQQNQPSNTDIEASQRELINDLMSWIFQNKLLYTGPNGVEQFSNALLLHLQSLSSSPTVSTATGLMYNQYSDGGGRSASEDEQHSLANTNNVLLQQLASATGNTSETAEESNEELSEKETNETQGATPSTAGQGGVSGSVSQQQNQLAQLQALLLLQQQHQQLYQGGGAGGGATGGGAEGTGGAGSANVDTQQIQQLQQLHQLQTLLLQHLTTEKQPTPLQEVGGDGSINVTPSQSVMVSTGGIDSTHDSVGLSLTSELGSTTAVYATDESLVVGGASNEGSSQMWSQTSNTVHHESPLLMENEGGVQEEVELLEQDKANF